ncbi:MAG: purine-binding chemotaxis protein CheW [Magnetococcales bacterium]|nr:purine-binding chemotaxis protein CheW [Magnetococcales bacterium]
MESKNIEGSTQLLTFLLDGEVFAVDISKIREVLEFTSVTKVPRTPPFMRGVINLRGSVVPVVDLRAKFNMPQGENSVNTCIIILEIAVDDGITVMGAIADSVQEVIKLEPEQINTPPKLGTRLPSDYLMGVGKHDDNFIMILNVDKILSAEELSTNRQDNAA